MCHGAVRILTPSECDQIALLVLVLTLTSSMTEFFPTGNDGTVPQHFEPTMADHFAVFSPFQELNAWSAAQPDDNWQQPNFDMAPGQVDAETQALLDTILQPHLNIDVGHDNDRMFPYPGI